MNHFQVVDAAGFGQRNTSTKEKKLVGPCRFLTNVVMYSAHILVHGCTNHVRLSKTTHSSVV